jgi:hypothetical protein
MAETDKKSVTDPYEEFVYSCEEYLELDIKRHFLSEFNPDKNQMKATILEETFEEIDPEKMKGRKQYLEMILREKVREAYAPIDQEVQQRLIDEDEPTLTIFKEGFLKWAALQVGYRWRRKYEKEFKKTCFEKITIQRVGSAVAPGYIEGEETRIDISEIIYDAFEATRIKVSDERRTRSILDISNHMLNRKITGKFWEYYNRERPPLIQSLDQPTLKNEGGEYIKDSTYESITDHIPDAMEKTTESPKFISATDPLSGLVWGNKDNRAMSRGVVLAILQFCVDRLTLKQLQTLYCLFSGESETEIAKRIGIKPGSVFDTKYNAINNIRKCLSEV